MTLTKLGARPPHPSFTALRDNAMEQAPEAARLCVGDEALRERLVASLRYDLMWCENMDFARGFASHCPIEGVPPEAYLHRVLHIHGHTVLAGIRFKGGDLAHPFVDLLASTMSQEDDALGSALHELLEEFEAFHPAHIRVLSDPEFGSEWLRSEWHIEVDQYIVAGRVRDMARGEISPGTSLQDTTQTTESINFIDTTYADTFRLAPELATVVFPATAEDLEQCLESGVVTWIMQGDERCGLLATYAHRGPLCAGPCVMEELVAPSHRGSRLAAQAQRLLARRIANTMPDAVFWGTIDARNQASLHTARHAGRLPIAAWHWLSVR